jgi:hypothetical protein
VKITPEGRAKVLDFGLAKIHESDNVSQNLSNSPTLVDVETARGLILGTAAYMSPEQARGKGVDQRADVWAFGCVLYEMLTARQTFPNGETVSDTLAGILTREPDWQALPDATPPRIRALLERCLQKDVRSRRRDMSENRIDIEEAGIAQTATDRTSASQPSRRRRYMWSVLLVVLLLVTAAFVLRAVLAPAPDTPAVQFEISLPSGVAGGAPLELSPNGRKVAFQGISQQRAHIWVRPLDASEAQPLPATEGLAIDEGFFWSADSQYIAFFTPGKLNKVAATGGPAQVVCDLPAGRYSGGTWNAEGVILLGRSQTGPILRVPAAGGEPTPLTELDASRKETRHAYPHFLPDGRHFLYVAQSGTLERVAYVGTLDSKERHSLSGIASEVKYSSTGRVLFIRDGWLMAQPFDLKHLELAGQVFSVAELGLPPLALSGA